MRRAQKPAVRHLYLGPFGDHSLMSFLSVSEEAFCHLSHSARNSQGPQIIPSAFPLVGTELPSLPSAPLSALSGLYHTDFLSVRADATAAASNLDSLEAPRMGFEDPGAIPVPVPLP